MKIAEFSDMFIGIHMKEGETKEQVEDRLIEALETVDENFVATYKLKISEYSVFQEEKDG